MIIRLSAREDEGIWPRMDKIDEWLESSRENDRGDTAKSRLL